MEHEAQPHQGDEHQLVEKEIGNHGKTPSYTGWNEGILLGFPTAGISRRLEVHDPTFEQPRTLVERLIDRGLVANGAVEIRDAIPTHPRGARTRCCQWRQDDFHHVGELLHLADRDRGTMLLVVARDGGFMGVTAVNRDRLGDAMPSDGLGQKPFGGLLIVLFCPQEIHGLAGIIHGAIEIST
jgi:hypothetical protein